MGLFSSKTSLIVLRLIEIALDFFSKEWVQSTIPYAISISLRTIRDILDENKFIDHDCLNMTVWTVACNIVWLYIEDKYHFMDLQLCVS
jgi:hypothetical protein